MKNIREFWTDDKGFSYLEVIIICGVIAVILLLTVPNKINQMIEAHREIDQHHGNIIGKATENLLKTDEAFSTYQVERLPLQEDMSDYGELDRVLIVKVRSEIERFEVDEIPKIKYKKFTYKYFSITIKNNAVYIFADSGGEATVQVYPAK